MTRRSSSIRGYAAPLLPFAAALLMSCGGSGDGESPAADAVASDEPCGQVTIARMDWTSAETMAEIDRLVLEAGYGCEATLVAGDTLPTFVSMRTTGEPNLAPELWTGAMTTDVDTAVAAGELVLGADTLRDGGREGFYITRDVADAHPEIRTVEDALARPELFPSSPTDPTGALHTCPAGWNCAVSQENLFRAYGADAMGFALVQPASAEALDASVADAVAAGTGWLGYYWSPTALLGRFGLVPLDGAPHDADEWERCTAVADCPDPQINGYMVSEVRAAVTPGFARKADVAMDYISTRGWDNDTVNDVLAWIADNGATGAEGARYFFENHESVWTGWVDAATAERVRAAL